MAPEKLGKYRLLQLIATGGMGEVFLARQDGPAGFSKAVVIKRILRHLATDQSFVDMFVNEARLAGQLQHPNIVQIFELGHEGDDWYIAMEYVHGRPLHSIVDESMKLGRRTDPRIAARICAQALQGLLFAHQLKDESGKPLGILHRDVTPDNVLVSFAGGVKLVDFGIAKAMNAQSSTRTGTLKGKVSYMAPEQFTLGATLDARTDLYAMGVTFHELLTNSRPPCVPESHEEAMTKPRVGFSRRHDLHAAVNDILERALYPNPKDRFASADEMARALEDFVSSTGDTLEAAQVAEWLVGLFGKEAADANSAVAPRPANPGTDVLSAPFLIPNSAIAGDFVQSAPTMIEKRLQGPLRRDTDPPLKAVTAVPASRLPMIAAAGALLLLLGVVIAWGVKPPGGTVSPDTSAVSAGGTPTERPERKHKSRIDRPAPVSPAVARSSTRDRTARSPRAMAEERPRAVRKRVVPRPGRVTVKVNPWAEVIYEGRNYGVTPVAAITVPAGIATFTLRNKQGVTKKVSIKVPPGGEVVLKADLAKAKAN